MVEVIVAPDAEGRAVAFLTARFASVSEPAKVSTKVSNPRPPRFVRVVRAGGATRGIAYDSPRLVFECSAASSVDAERLCALTRGFILAWARLDDSITRVQDAGDMAYVPDPDTGQDRYQFAVQVDMKMSVL